MRAASSNPGILRRWLVACAALLLASPVHAADVPMPSAGPVEPILLHAEADLKALRGARTAFGAAVVVLPANHISHMAMPSLLDQAEAPPELIPATGLLAASSLGMLVLPTVVDLRAQASRRSIVAQGAQARRVSTPWATALLSAVPIVLWGIPEAGEDREAGRVALVYGAYAAALALPLGQLRQNRRARVRAGWVGDP